MRFNCLLGLTITVLVVLLGLYPNRVSGRIYSEDDDVNLLGNNVLNSKVSRNNVSGKRNTPSNNNSIDIENEVLQTNSVSDNGISHNNANSNSSSSNTSSSYVIRMLSKAFRFLNLKQMVKNIQDGRSTPGVCMACKFSMAMVKHLIDYGNGAKDISYVITYLCKTLNVQTARVCEGYVTNILEEFVMVMSRINLNSNEICGTLLGEHCSLVNHPLHNWTLPLPQISHLRKSLLLNSLNFRWPFSARKPRYFKVLQISDIHLDPDYAEGSNAVCGEPLCCRKNSPGSDKPKNENKAGYWGDYRDCDIPLRTVERTFESIRNNHPDIDYILWTGDIPPHDIWNQTRKGNLELIKVVSNLFNRYFSHIPIYPVVGNHESCPMNSFPQPEISDKYSNSWLYEQLSESWLKWLPLETRSTIEKGAYFAARAKVGLKIISLNTNFCSSQNWWILLNSTDPGQQLEWLIRQLQESENLGEMVQIIGHIPPGTNDCIQMWSRNYNHIINRFSHIIKGQFFGHTHNDEFEIFYEDVSQPPKSTNAYSKAFRASNVAYIGPSITTFGNVNPGYRIYLVDEETFDIVDHHTYTLNLTEANLNRDSKPLQFRLSYSAKDSYGLKSLSAVEWHQLVMRMRTPTQMDDRVVLNKAADANELFKKFYRNIFNLSDNIGESNKCDDEACKYEVLCRLITATSQDHSLCQHFLL